VSFTPRVVVSVANFRRLPPPEGVFLLVGSLQPRAGGAIMAHGVSRSDLESRINQDPFVAEDVVSAELLEISCNKANPRLGFLLD